MQQVKSPGQQPIPHLVPVYTVTQVSCLLKRQGGGRTLPPQVGRTVNARTRYHKPAFRHEQENIESRAVLNLAAGGDNSLSVSSHPALCPDSPLPSFASAQSSDLMYSAMENLEPNRDIAFRDRPMCKYLIIIASSSLSCP